MDKYYKRKRGLFASGSEEPFKLSRSKIDLFLECPKCFYLDRRLGIGRPKGPGFSLNLAVDALLKKEFDLLRKKGEAHELMKHCRINLIPYSHPDLETWRTNFIGKQYFHKETNLIIFGSIDDVWVDKKGELSLVDYKATSTKEEISLEDEYKQGYKRQMEIYQWIFRRSGFKVSDTGYFVFANAGKNRPSFDGRLEFALSIIPYLGDSSWVEPVVFEMKKCLESDKTPVSDPECEYCKYLGLIKEL